MANLTTTTIDGSVTEKIGTATVSGTTITVDLATGNFFEIDFSSGASGDIATFTISNTSGTHISSFVLKITQDDPNRQITWGSLSAVKWPGGTGPTLTSGAQQAAFQDKDDILSFTTYDYGTTWLGTVVGQNYS